MLKDAVGKVKSRFTERRILSYLFGWLPVIGIRIEPFYITQEFPLDEVDKDLKPKLEPIVAGFLSLPEIEAVYAHPESEDLNAEKRRNLEDGCLCFGLKYNNEIVAFAWCNLQKCHEVYPFPLKEDEVYLTGAFTFKAYRGMNLAPFIRKQLSSQLWEKGRTKFYSLTNVFNTPAIKFKKKIKAKPLKIILSIKLFDKHEWRFMMRSPKHFVVLI
jgi:hypothetical protein